MTIIEESVEPIHVSASDVAEHIDLELAARAAWAAAGARASGQVEARRLTLPYDGGWMRIMAASIPQLDVFGYKEFHLSSAVEVRYAVHLFNLSDGRPRGVVDAALVTTLRTAATAALAAENYFGARRRVRLGVVGTGAEALAGVRALTEVVELDGIRIMSRGEANRAKFVAQLDDLGLQAQAVATARAACEGADLVYVATNSEGKVVLTAQDVVGVALVASIGSTLPIQRELDTSVIEQASRIIIDTPDVLEESGDFLALDAPPDRDRICLLGQMPQFTWDRDHGLALYKSIGSPEQDIALAEGILAAARDRGFGRPMPPLSAIKMNL